MSRRQVPALFVVLSSDRMLNTVKADLSLTMRVLDSGQGTIEDPSAFWFEVARREFPTVKSLMQSLTARERLHVVEQTTEGGGQDLARQLPLIPRCENGVWAQSIVCGEPMNEALLKPDPEVQDQMSLFDE